MAGMTTTKATASAGTATCDKVRDPLKELPEFAGKTLWICQKPAGHDNRGAHLMIECLEYQTGFLSGLMLGSWGEPEQLNRYASRYAIVLALLGRTGESAYQTGIANTAALFIGRPAKKAWSSRPLRRRFLAGPGPRYRWEQAYTESLFMEADDNLHRIQDDVAEFRAQIEYHFDTVTAVRGA